VTGELLASGRDGDIYEYAPGLVLRRTKDGRSIAGEARLMQYVADHGYPVPRIEEVRADGTEIVMERIDGPLMMDTMTRDPRQLLRGADLLAELHDQLHSIPAPDWLRRLDGDGPAILHLDLHPLNVMMSTRGPVVIDWANAAVGDPLTDVAFTYVLLTAPEAPLPRWQQLLIEPLRSTIARRFAKRYRGPAFDAQLELAAQLKQLDPNMSSTEIARMAKLVEKVRRKSAKAPG
jgi:aminoglycoside phosphotransferase (APT) family kinase protein